MRVAASSSCFCLLFAMLLMLTVPANAQEWMRMHRRLNGQDWTMPLRIDAMPVDVNADHLVTHSLNKDENDITVPLSLSTLDSITFARLLADEEKGHNKYRCFTLFVNTLDKHPITDKDLWMPCVISLDGKGEYENYSGTAMIRGRGNSTWEWYDKKPYKFKLDSKSKLLGLEKAKNWNLLANYRDVTDMMNVVGFEVARCLGMPHTNHTRFVELFVNDEYMGTYQLTEKIEQDENRVDIDKEEGVIISFDLDDGPSLSPGSTDNFTSLVYGLPVCVKHPSDPSPAFIESLRNELAVIERAIQKHNYALVDSLVDVQSMIGILQVHEYLYNVEIDAPRSIYAYRDKGGKLTFGPVWDWDAAFDFDWSNMKTGHTFFNDYRELIYGTQPASHQGASYNVSGFWTDMFQDSDFVSLYKQRWENVSDSLLVKVWNVVDQYAGGLQEGAYLRDIARWPIQGKDINTELLKMYQWLEKRLNYMNSVIAGYPTGTPYVSEDDEADYQITDEGIVIHKNIVFSRGYSQSGTIEIPQEVVTKQMGVTPQTLTPLNADGSTGQNTAAGTYGAWFDKNGNTNPWASGHVYIESNDMYVWQFGCHPDNCMVGDTHTVRMQYARGRKSLVVTIHFTII